MLFSHLSCLYCYTTNFGFIIKCPFNNYDTWCCIAAAGKRATIPLENVVPHKEYFVESYVIEEAVSRAVGHFNDDKITVVHMFGALGMPAG